MPSFGLQGTPGIPKCVEDRIDYLRAPRMPPVHIYVTIYYSNAVSCYREIVGENASD